MKENEEELGCGHSCSSCASCGSQVNEEIDMEEGVLTFTDEEGKDVEFQILDTIVVEDKEYLVVIPLDEESEEEDEKGVVILEIKEEDGEEVYDTVVDEEEGQKVFELFQKQWESEDDEDEESDDEIEGSEEE